MSDDLQHRRFRAMGTDVHLAATAAPEGALDLAEGLVHDLEARWSRFLEDNELCRINEHAGLPVVVSEPTFSVVRLAVEGWWATAGRYDPTVLTSLEAAGYDRPYRTLVAQGRRGGPTTDDRALAAPSPAPGCAEVQLLEELPAVLVPPGVALDLGGIGKGAAADRVVELLRNAGCDGACANLGGDVRVWGRGPAGDGWNVGVDGADATQLAVLALADGAVATSSPSARAWTGPDGTSAHHLIDPATGRPAPRGPASVTVVAGSAALAEVLAKAAFLAPDDLTDVLGPTGAAGLVVDGDGSRRTAGPWEELLA